MKKNLIVASIACACASAFNAYADAETPPRYLNWFTGIGDAAASEPFDLAPVNGLWTIGTGDKSYDAEAGFVYDLDSNQAVVFAATPAAAPDTGTVTRVELTSYFTPVVCADYSEILVPASGDFAFAAVAKTNADQTAEFSYRVWTGGDSWAALDGVAPNSEEDIPVTLIATFDYRDNTAKKVDFSIVTNGVTNVFETAILTSAVGDGVGGLTCSGSGNVIAFNGEVAEAIAEMDGKKYISLAEASEAVSSANDKTITMLAETPESITLTDGATITNANGYVKGEISADENSTITIALKEEDIGNGASGEYTIPVKTAGSGTVNVTVPLSNKEIAFDHTGAPILTTGKEIKLMIQTKADILADVKPDTANTGKAFAAATAENKSYTNNALRVFLAKYASDAYTNASASAEGITTALRTTPENANGLALWQDYVLGIAPTDAVKPLSPAAGDGEADSIKFEIPALAAAAATASGDYTVTYEVYKDENKLDVEQTASAIKVPLIQGTGTYTVKAVLTPANN